jgi:type IV secretory pathway TrbF-like protein
MASASVTAGPITKALSKEYEYYGSTLTTNYALRLVCMVMGVVILGQAALNIHLALKMSEQRPYIVRINDIGRAEAVKYPYSANYVPQDMELRYFLKEFTIGYLSRNHQTFTDLYKNSLYYLSEKKFEEVDAESRKTKWIPAFLNDSAGVDVNVRVGNVVLDKSQQPMKAQIDFEKVHVQRDGMETKREQYTANVYFVVDPKNANVEHNPLGFAIQDVEAFQAIQKE